MAELASLRERLDAYLAIIADDPSLDDRERERLFSYAVWPERLQSRERINYEHLMTCREKFCRYCAGTGIGAA